MKALRLVPLVLILAACSSVNLPLSPYRIDVQQGNALEQESVEKLKLGLSRSQVRFLLGTPLLVDPFHGNRWDYVYNFRKAGKLTEKRRLALFFDGDLLVRIEAEGMTLKNDQSEAKPAVMEKPAEKAVEQPRQAVAETAAVAVAQPLENTPPQPGPVAAVATAAKPAQSAPVQAAPEPAARAQPAQATPAQPAAAGAASMQAAATGARGLEETSVVPPLRSDQGQVVQPQRKPAAVSAATTEPLALQAEANVEAIKPDAMQEFPNIPSPATQEGQVMAALKAWSGAWRSRDEEAYLAAYAKSFRPAGGQSRDDWERSRRLLLGVSRNVDLQIDGITTGFINDGRAQVSFRQFYRSDNYRDEVIKQLVFVRVGSRWLIEEENVLSTIKGK